MQYHKHREYLILKHAFGCDLLEKSYFCSITNIRLTEDEVKAFVVICLKNRTFAVSQTSEDANEVINRSCDLLEKSYFCSITNIIFKNCKASSAVVICLKNRTFAVSQTSNAYYWYWVKEL